MGHLIGTSACREAMLASGIGAARVEPTTTRHAPTVSVKTIIADSLNLPLCRVKGSLYTLQIVSE